MHTNVHIQWTRDLWVCPLNGQLCSLCQFTKMDIADKNQMDAHCVQCVHCVHLNRHTHKATRHVSIAYVQDGQTRKSGIGTMDVHWIHPTVRWTCPKDTLCPLYTIHKPTATYTFAQNRYWNWVATMGSLSSFVTMTRATSIGVKPIMPIVTMVLIVFIGHFGTIAIESTLPPMDLTSCTNCTIVPMARNRILSIHLYFIHTMPGLIIRPLVPFLLFACCCVLYCCILKRDQIQQPFPCNTALTVNIEHIVSR